MTINSTISTNSKISMIPTALRAVRDLGRLVPVAAGIVALMTGCPPVENTSDSNSSSSSSSSSSNSNSTNPTATVTATVTITTTATGTSTGTGTATDTSSTSGGSVCESGDDFTCAGAFDCGDDCGALDSRFDENGCLRPSCSEAGDCGEDEICYGALWGICVGSEFMCADNGDVCECGGTDDCGGNYCVPASALPPSATPPTGARLDFACSPDDGSAVKLELGLVDQGATCKSELSDPWLRLTVWFMEQPLAPGLYPVSQVNHSDGGIAAGGWLMIDSWQGDVVSGSYKVVVGEQLFEGSFMDSEFCGSVGQCG